MSELLARLARAFIIGDTQQQQQQASNKRTENETIIQSIIIHRYTQILLKVLDITGHKFLLCK